MPLDYLKLEYKERINKGPIEYKLQVQLHEAKPDDSHLILHIGRRWDESSHPWLDVADLKMTTLLSPKATECLKYIYYHLPPSIDLLPAQSVDDPNVILHVRQSVYAWSQKLRSMRSNNKVPDTIILIWHRISSGWKLGASQGLVQMLR